MKHTNSNLFKDFSGNTLTWNIFLILIPYNSHKKSISKYIHFRSSHQRCSVRKGVLRKFTKFTGKHMCQSLYFNKVAGLCFPVNFVKFLRTPFLQNTSGRLLLSLPKNLLLNILAIYFPVKLIFFPVKLINAPLNVDWLASYSSYKLLIGLLEFNRESVETASY